MDWTKRTQKTPGINALDSGDRLGNQASIRLPADVAIDTLDSGDRLENALTPGTPKRLWVTRRLPPSPGMTGAGR